MPYPQEVRSDGAGYHASRRVSDNELAVRSSWFHRLQHEKLIRRYADLLHGNFVLSIISAHIGDTLHRVGESVEPMAGFHPTKAMVSFFVLLFLIRLLG